MADEKDTDPTADEAVDGSDAAAARSKPAGRRPTVPDTTGPDPTGEAALDEDVTDEAALDEDATGEADDDRELVGVGSRTSTGRGGTARSGAPATRTGGPEKKGRATPKQHSGTDGTKRATPAEFVRGSVAELKKVVYPSRSQLGNYFVVVLVFVLMVIAIVTGLDYGFGWLMLKVFS